MNIIKKIKGAVYNEIKKRMLRAFPELSMVARTVSENNNIGKHVEFYVPYVIYRCNIGDYTYISNNSNISLTNIGKCCAIGPNLICGWGIHPLNGLSIHPMFYSNMKQNGITLSKTNKIEERKWISIGNDVFIGANVTILDGVSIGDGAVIGAGAVVTSDIPPYAIAAGNPAKVIKYRFPQNKIDELRKIQWWNFKDKDLNDIETYFWDIDGFIEKYTTKEQTLNSPL